MDNQIIIRTLAESDYEGWRPLWDAYNAFYGRSGSTALPEAITAASWARFFSADEPVHALVAVDASGVLGLAHYLFHRSTTRLHDVCYLQDLFTVEARRGQGIAKRLIQAVYDKAASAGSSRVYWQTHSDNLTARTVYDKLAKHSGFVIYAHELTVV